MADKSLYDTFVLMGDGFDRGSDLLSRLQNAFSPIRENLLEWYDFGEGKTLLEIGAGCMIGAYSYFLSGGEYGVPGGFDDVEHTAYPINHVQTIFFRLVFPPDIA